MLRWGYVPQVYSKKYDTTPRPYLPLSVPPPLKTVTAEGQKVASTQYIDDGVFDDRPVAGFSSYVQRRRGEVQN